MASSKKTIITCAITGSSHTPTMSPYLPYTPDDIVRQSIDAAKAGAAIVHLHARNPHDGSPSPDPALFRDYVTRIKAESDVIISLTTGGATGGVGEFPAQAGMPAYSSITEQREFRAAALRRREDTAA